LSRVLLEAQPSRRKCRHHPQLQQWGAQRALLAAVRADALPEGIPWEGEVVNRPGQARDSGPPTMPGFEAPDLFGCGFFGCGVPSLFGLSCRGGIPARRPSETRQCISRPIAECAGQPAGQPAREEADHGCGVVVLVGAGVGVTVTAGVVGARRSFMRRYVRSIARFSVELSRVI